MSKFFSVVPARDNRDIGYRTTAHMTELHYYRSNHTSNLALSHCGVVTPKSALLDKDDFPKCKICELVESYRDKID